MIESSIKLDAYMLDRIGMNYDTLPIHPKYGISTCLHHGEFTGKGGNTINECAGAWYRTHEDWYLAQVAEEMKKYQEVADAPPPPVIVTPPPPEQPMSTARAKHLFGTLRVHDVSGKVVKKAGFNPDGQISILWLERGKSMDPSLGESKRYPQAQDRYVVADNDQGPTRDRVTREIVTFEDGALLVRASPRSGWSWI